MDNCVTEKTYRALCILNKYDRLTAIAAREFAMKMWPNGKWNRIYNTGNGATSGKGMWLSAGSYLAKLHNRGLVSRDVAGYTVVWCASSDGRKAIADYEEANQ